MKSITFAVRNMKELLRDFISYIFCLGLPIIMLVVMTLINQSIPQMEGAPKVFNIEKLTPAMAVFAMTFLMLFVCIRVSSDRASAFLTRLYASPMKSSDFIIGYVLPFALTGIIQALITYLCGEVISLIVDGQSLNIGYMLLSIPLLIPAIVLFIGIGIIFGTFFNAKAAPGLCSAVITGAAILGGIWMDIDTMGDGWKTVCSCLPFYHSVQYARYAFVGNFSDMLTPMLICTAFTLVIFTASIIAFAFKMKSDKK